MSDIIQQMAAEAKASVPVNQLNVTEWIAAYNQKFAELIINKCAEIAKHQQDFYNEHNDGIVNSEIDVLIKHYFGVK